MSRQINALEARVQGLTVELRAAQRYIAYLDRAPVIHDAVKDLIVDDIDKQVQDECAAITDTRPDRIDKECATVFPTIYTVAETVDPGVPVEDEVHLGADADRGLDYLRARYEMVARLERPSFTDRTGVVDEIDNRHTLDDDRYSNGVHIV